MTILFWIFSKIIFRVFKPHDPNIRKFPFSFLFFRGVGVFNYLIIHAKEFVWTKQTRMCTAFCLLVLHTPLWSYTGTPSANECDADLHKILEKGRLNSYQKEDLDQIFYNIIKKSLHTNSYLKLYEFAFKKNWLHLNILGFLWTKGCQEPT